MTAQILDVGVGQHTCYRKGDASHPQGEDRSVRNLLGHQLGDPEISGAGVPVGAQGQGFMLTLHDIIRLREMDAVAAVHPLQPGQALVDLKDHRAGGLEDGTPGVVGDAQAAVALVIRQRDGDKCRVAADVPVPVEAGQGAQDHGQELDQATGLQLPLVIPQVPAVIVEGDLLRVALHHLGRMTSPPRIFTSVSRPFRAASALSINSGYPPPKP